MEKQQNSEQKEDNSKKINSNVNDNIESEKDSEYPKNNIIFSKKRTRHSISSHAKYIKNPSITKFNKNSLFIFDIDEGRYYINSVKNANNIKLNEDELKILINKYYELKNEQSKEKGQQMILLDQTILNEINNYFKESIIEDSLIKFLKNEYISNTNRNGFTSRKLSRKYFITTGNRVSHTTISNVLKYKLGYRYLKVAPKTNKIISPESIIISMGILKIVSRCIKEKISIIYVDESTILNINNNLRTWIIPGENLYSRIENKKRCNLIMAINENGVVHYTLNEKNTNDEIFQEFIQDLLLKLKEKHIYNFALFLDNFSGHKTNKLIKFYSEQKIKIIFNTPYYSNFNAIEYGFRGLKNILYKKVYESMESLKCDINLILNSSEFQRTIKYGFKDTILEYLRFFEKNKNINFNNLKNLF